jgi:predicted DNA-binding transcriptional regulator
LSETFPAEKLFIKVIDDLADFLPYLVLVGGWVPYVYAKYKWKNVANLAVSTSDIDFGVGNKEFKGKGSIASYVRKLGYGERHVSMDRMVPFVPIVRDASNNLKAEVEFIADPQASKEIINKLIGGEIKINEIDNFNLLLESVEKVTINKQKVQIPTEEMFVFHKLLTFVQRKNSQKFKKDLYYVYYMLRFSTRKDELIDEVKLLIKNKEQGKRVKQNISKYFGSVDSEGALLVEQENGPDDYIANLKQDIFERFNSLLKFYR